MAKGRDNDQVMGRGTPGETEGGYRPTGVSPGEIGLGPLGQGQRWTAARKREVVLRLFRGEPLDLVSRELGVELYRLEKWRDAALEGREEALQARNGETPSRPNWTRPGSASASSPWKMNCYGSG